MWYQHEVTVEPTEVVTIAQARQQARTEVDDGHDEELTRLITVARQYVEKVTGLLIGAQTVVVKCDSFEDMARLPVAPVNSITSIQYIDADGDTQTLAASVYELRGTGSIEPSIVLKFNQSWPTPQVTSLITVTAACGYASPAATLVQAMLLKISEMFAQHSPSEMGGLSTVDALLMNDRRNA